MTVGYLHSHVWGAIQYMSQPLHGFSPSLLRDHWLLYRLLLCIHSTLFHRWHIACDLQSVGSSHLSSKPVLRRTTMLTATWLIVGCLEISWPLLVRTCDCYVELCNAPVLLLCTLNGCWLVCSTSKVYIYSMWCIFSKGWVWQHHHMLQEGHWCAVLWLFTWHPQCRYPTKLEFQMCPLKQVLPLTWT